MFFFKLRTFVGFVAGFLFSLVPTKERKIADLQLKKFLASKNPSPIIRKMYTSLGQSFMESLNFSPLLAESEKFIHCSDIDKVERWLSQKRGIVCLTAHTGNWDLLAAYMIKKGAQLTVIGKQAKNNFVQKFIENLRSKYGAKIIWRADKKAAAEIIKELTGNRVVAGLIDQDTRVTSVMSLFLGAPAKTPSTLISLAQKTNALIVYAFIVRTGFITFEIIVNEIDATLKVEEILANYHKALGDVIINHPSQWVWFHKRWRTMENGKTLSSKEYIRSF